MKLYQPMLLSTAYEPIASPLWISEIKWDGYRALAYVTRKATRVISRNRRDLTGLFPELRSMGEALASNAVLDGEIVKIGERGMPDFDAIRRADVPAVFVAFDLLERRGRDLTAMTLEQRRERLRDIVHEQSGVVLFSRTFDDAAALYERMIALEGEGIVQKRLGSRYASGERSRDWVKIHTPHGREVVAARGERFYR